VSKIKITGYVDTDEFGEESLDLSDRSGLSSSGYEELMRTSVEDLDDVRVELES
jgi:hypothetical protein